MGNPNLGGPCLPDRSVGGSFLVFFPHGGSMIFHMGGPCRQSQSTAHRNGCCAKVFIVPQRGWSLPKGKTRIIVQLQCRALRIFFRPFGGTTATCGMRHATRKSDRLEQARAKWLSRWHGPPMWKKNQKGPPTDRFGKHGPPKWGFPFLFS